MAKIGRPSKYNWEEIKKHYQAGKNQSEIVLEFGCAKSSLSERIKKENWTQSEQVKSYIKGAVELSEQKANLIEQDNRVFEIAEDIISQEIRRKGLIFDASELIVKRATDLLKSNRTIEKINVGAGIQQIEPRELDSSDLKNLADTIDKASITLGVNQRHSNSQININNENINAQQANIEQMSEKEITNSYLDIIKK